jgi:hypothetical protein
MVMIMMMTITIKLIWKGTQKEFVCENFFDYSNILLFIKEPTYLYLLQVK